MAHRLEKRNGHIEAAFAGTTPWHGLGMMVEERMSPMEALDKAGLDWHVDKVQAFCQPTGMSDQTVIIPDAFATVRTDTMEALGCVGPQYTVLQNKEQAEFIETLVGNGCVVECVGALEGGKRVFWTVKSPQDMIVKDSRFEDRITKYLIVYNAHDGSGALKALWSPVRAVCANTVRIALSDMSDGVSIRHTKSIKARIQEAQRVLGLTKAYYENINEVFNGMANIELGRHDFTSYLDAIFGNELDEKTLKIDKRIENKKLDVSSNLKAEQIETSKSNVTLWDAFNAVTYNTSHQMGGRKTKRLAEAGDRKFDTVMFGQGSAVRQKAFKAALAMMG